MNHRYDIIAGMSDIITLPKVQFDIMKNRIAYLENIVRKIADKVHISQEELEMENPYKEGTDEWWNFEIAAGEADLMAGRYTTLRNHEEIKQFFEAL
jgi:hypothetical protein